MPTSPLNVVIQHLRTDLVPDSEGMTDRELLARFLGSGDGDALAALVHRHAHMVWGVCHRILDHHDAEDAFQATFLVLVRKAADVPRDAVANWLYGVARQTAVRLRATSAKRGRRETQVVNMPEPTVPEVPDTDLQESLDEELSRLPGHYRSVLVLCDLEGMTRKEAARQLGIPEGSVASRLARAREMLARRLTQRGVVLTGGWLAAGVAVSAPTTLAASTIKAATLHAVGQEAAIGAFSTQVTALTEGVLKAMLLSKLKATLVAVLVLSFVVSGGFAFIYQTVATQSDKSPIAEERGKMPPNPQKNDDIAHERRSVISGPISKLPLPKPAEPSNRGPLAVAVTASGKEVGVPCDTFGGHIAAIYSVVFSPDGKTLASGSEDKTIKLWDVKTGTITSTLEGHTKTIRSVAFSPDGKTLASGSDDKTIKMWDVKTGKSIATLEGHTEMVWSVTFAPDGKTVASAGGNIKLWDAATGKNSATLKDEGCGFVAFTKDGKLLASGAHSIKVWDVLTAKHTVIFKGHSNFPIVSMAISPNGKVLAGGELGPFRSSVKLWDVATGKDTGIQGGTSYAVAFSPDGAILASVGGQTIQLSEVSSGKSLATLKADAGWAGGWSLAYSPDGKTLAAGGLARDFGIKLWEVANLTTVAQAESLKDGPVRKANPAPPVATK